MSAVHLDGAYNVRDIGGLPARGRGQARPGLLYRGDSLDTISGRDAELLFGELAIGAVIDVRTPAEIAPAAWRERGVRYRQIALIDADRLGQQPMAAATSPELAAVYLADLRRGARALARICAVLAEELAAGVPCLVHCAAGRDRTGAIVAVLLSAVGVRDGGVSADYAASNEQAEQVTRRLAANPMYANGLAPGGRPVPASPDTITELLAGIRRDHGSASNFLVGCGLEPSALAAIETALIEPVT